MSKMKKYMTRDAVREPLRTKVFPWQRTHHNNPHIRSWSVGLSLMLYQLI